MSYSYLNHCWNCKNNEKCTDHKILAEALDKIHSNTIETGHLGSGNIILSCFQYDKKEKA